MLALAAALILTGSCAPDAEPFDTEGYRSERYRAPVDRDPAPAQPITTGEAQALFRAGIAIWIDVLPAEGAYRDAQGRWHLAQVHQTIPRALWFPEVGRSNPEPALWRAFAARVADERRKRPSAAIVVFCRADCWMSWNAARRLARSGMTRVRWYADGIEDWHAKGGTLVDARPEPAPYRSTPRGE